MSVNDTLVAACLATCWLLTAAKACDILVVRHNPAVTALVLAVAVLSTALTAQVIANDLDRICGQPDIGTLTACGCAVIGAAGVHLTFALITDRDTHTRRRLIIRTMLTSGVLTTATTLFIITPPSLDAMDAHGETHQHPSAAHGTLWAGICMTYLAVQFSELMLLGHRHTAASWPLVRYSMHTFTLGAALGVICAVLTIGQLLMETAHAAFAWLLDDLADAAFTSSITLMIIGVTAPSWGARLGLDRAAATVAAVRAYRRLRPLWLDLTQAVRTRNHGTVHHLLPELQGMTAPFALISQARTRTVRIVAEIGQAIHKLAPYRSADAAEHARKLAISRGLTGHILEATVEASILAVAVQDSRPARRPAPLARAVHADSLAAELHWLRTVAAAYNHSTVVSQTVASFVPQQRDTAA